MIDDLNSARLPDFRTPPVSEVVLSVSFRPIRGLRTVELLELWRTHYRTSFPRVEENLPYEPPVEFLDRPNAGPLLRFGIGEARLSPRLWFLTDDGTSLLQLQSDWFAANWRRMTPEDTYDRYLAVRELFQQRLEELQDFVHVRQLGELVPQQCEVTYVNQITQSGVWKGHGDVDKALLLLGRSSGQFLHDLESLQLNATAVMTDENKPIGRLYISANPAFTPNDNEPVMVLTLTARGEPKSSDVAGVLDFVEIAHRWVVLSFLDITSPEMHTAWGRQ